MNVHAEKSRHCRRAAGTHFYPLELYTLYVLCVCAFDHFFHGGMQQYYAREHTHTLTLVRLLTPSKCMHSILFVVFLTRKIGEDDPMRNNSSEKKKKRKYESTFPWVSCKPFKRPQR